MEQQFHATGAAAVGSERTGTHAIDRAAQLLVLVLTAERPSGLGELAQAAELPKSTASRLLEALERQGLVAQDGARGRFSVGPVLLRFGQRGLLDRRLAELGQPHLHALAEASGETVNLAVPGALGVEHVAEVSSRHFLGTGRWVGRRVPYHCTAVGKILLAFGAAALPDGPLEPLTAETVVDRGRLDAELAAVRRDETAVAADELEPGLTAVAAPVRGEGGDVVGALTISGPTIRLAPDRLAELGPRLAREARALSARLTEKAAPAASREESPRMTDKVNPDPGILLYTRIKKSPYYYGSRRHGVQLYSVYNHHYHPRHYGDPVEEYWRLLEGVTLWDVGGAERQVEISGPDAFAFTNMLTPRDLHKCDVGQCKYAFITDQHGGIINDPVLIRLEENRFWLSLADSDVLLWCRGLAVNAGLDVQITEPDVGPIQIQGPKSKEVMTDLFGADILDVPYYYMVHRELDGLQLVITRTGYTGELGYELYLTDASRNGLKLWDAVIQAGEPHGLEPIGPCHIRRIEGGILAHGCDMTIDENPYEVGYGYKWMVEFEQEQDFIGREALRDVSQRGVTRKLVGVEIGGSKLGSYNDGSMPDFFPVRSDGETVGKVTSACHSPRLDKNIGYAMVSVDHSADGVELEIERPGETVQGVVTDRVFFKPEKAEETLTATGTNTSV